jgi:hypothetical protein
VPTGREKLQKIGTIPAWFAYLAKEKGVVWFEDTVILGGTRQKTPEIKSAVAATT